MLSFTQTSALLKKISSKDNFLKKNINETNLEREFPFVETSQLAMRESWRKELSRPLYHIHKWWATRLGSVFRSIILNIFLKNDENLWSEYYKFQNFKDKIILDPFMGSGTTLGEGLKLGCKVVGIDINPISTFIVTQSLRNVSENELREEFVKLEEDISDEIKKFYQTVDRETGEYIPVLYYFLVKYLELPDGEIVPLFKNYIFSKDAYPAKKPNAKIICPHCWTILEGRYDSISLCCQNCQSTFNPQNGTVSGQYITSLKGEKYKIKELVKKNGTPPKHKLYALLALRKNGEKIYLSANQEDKRLFERAEERLKNESIPLPTMPIRPGYNTNQARGYNYYYWRDFFNPRQLLCLGLLLRSILKIEKEVIRDQFICLFSSILEFNNMFCSFKGEGTGAVRHIFSNHILKPERTPLENNIWGLNKGSGTFSSLFESRLIKAKRYLDDPFEISIKKNSFKNNNDKSITSSKPIYVLQTADWEEFKNSPNAALILNGDGGNLSIPDKCIDAVVTDPPYFDFVNYSELSDFFFAWLSPVLRDRYSYFSKDSSADSLEVQHKDPEIFSMKLSRVLKECRRVLKDDGILTFTFHHSNPEGWEAIYKSVTEAELTIVASHPVQAELRVSSAKSATKEPISIDAILVCRKKDKFSIGSNLLDLDDVKNRTNFFIKKLENSDIKLSKMDYFVIFSSQLIVESSKTELNFKEYSRYLLTFNSYEF